MLFFVPFYVLFVSNVHAGNASLIEPEAVVTLALYNLLAYLAGGTDVCIVVPSVLLVFLVTKMSGGTGAVTFSVKATVTIIVVVVVPGAIVPTLNVTPKNGRRAVPFTVRRITRSIGCGGGSVAPRREGLVSSFLAVSCGGVPTTCSPRVTSPVGKADLEGPRLFGSFVGL